MRILYDPTVDPPEADPTVTPVSVERRTGIRRFYRSTADVGWAAIVNGRLISEHQGMGCKAAAIRAAGTNRVIT